MTKYFTCKTLLLALTLYSCNVKNPKPNSSDISLLENLDLSTKTISEQSKYLYKTLESNLTKDNSSNQTNFLFPKAEVNYSISKNLHESILSIQDKFPISESDGKLNELYDNLNLFKENLLKIDERFSKDNAKQIFGLITLDNSKINSKNDFVSFLSKSTEQDFKLSLSRINNSVAILESKMLTHFNIESANPMRVIFNEFAGLVSQNCKRLNKGDTVEISAGVGAFSTVSNPQIIINGSNIKVGSDGVAKYSFKATGEKGMNVIPVYIEFTSADGSKRNSKVPVVYYIDN